MWKRKQKVESGCINSGVRLEFALVRLKVVSFFPKEVNSIITKIVFNVQMK